MRRDQIHKICANHILTKDMTLSQMPNNDRAYIWAANDFADQSVVLEKLCVKFKTADEAAKFYKAFENAKTYIKDDAAVETVKKEAEPQKVQTVPSPVPKPADANQTSLGGFVFSSTPTFKPQEVLSVGTPTMEKKPAESVKLSPFAGFTFGSKAPSTVLSPALFGSAQSEFKPVQKPAEVAVTPKSIPASEAKVAPASPGDDAAATDFVPTAEFKPVIPLPEIVEVKTGEEDAEVLLELRGKLLR